MITPEIITRINELAKKQRESALTAEECTEQSRLRRIYIDNIKGQIKSYMAAAKGHSHHENCSCGCHEKHGSNHVK